MTANWNNTVMRTQNATLLNSIKLFKNKPKGQSGSGLLLVSKNLMVKYTYGHTDKHR